VDVRETDIPGVKVLRPRRFSDARGFFSEVWSAARAAEAGIDAVFVQDNHSHSAAAGTVRGLHYQSPPSAQGKLVRVARGAIRDVVVDVRRGSPTYGRWVAEILSEENGLQLWVPRGMLHGFVTLTPGTDVLYKVDAPYDAGRDGAIRFDDPDLSIDWGVATSKAVLSEKDAAASRFRDFVTPFVYADHP
jgi:dTDP-4-dehydrorhamnose 3,5-epimerase